MSDPVTNAEIEDVLSSIRRLVSDDGAAGRKRRSAEPETPDRLVLTPAQRVSQEEEDATAEAEAAPGADPEETAMASEEQPDGSRTGSRYEMTLEQRIAELEAAISQRAGDWEPDGSETEESDETRPLEIEAGAPFDEEIAIEDRDAGEAEPDEAQEAAPDHTEFADPDPAEKAELAPPVADAAPADRAEPDDAAAEAAAENVWALRPEPETAPADAGAIQTGPAANADSHPSDATAAAPASVTEEEEVVVATSAAGKPDPDDAETPDLGETVSTALAAPSPEAPVWDTPESFAADSETAASPDKAGTEDTPDAGWSDVETAAPATDSHDETGTEGLEAEEPQDTPTAATGQEALEEPVSEMDAVQTDAAVFASERGSFERDDAGPVTLEDVRAPDEVEPQEAPPEDVYTATAATSTDGFAAEDDTAEDDANDLAVLDEEMLRELVAQLVREELQGVLGERITRNVRRLVRQEIHKALAVRDLD